MFRFPQGHSNTAFLETNLSFQVPSILLHLHLPFCRGASSNMGRLPFDQTFGNFRNRENGTEISWEKFQKIRKLLKFQKANHSTENSGNSGMKVKWNGNFQEKFFENLGIPHEVVLFSGKLSKSLNICRANKSSGELAIFNF